jgi:hypothetical protein
MAAYRVSLSQEVRRVKVTDESPSSPLAATVKEREKKAALFVALAPLTVAGMSDSSTPSKAKEGKKTLGSCRTHDPGRPAVPINHESR